MVRPDRPRRGLAVIARAIATLALVCAAFVTTTGTARSAPAAWYTGGDPPAGYLATPGGNAGGFRWMLDNAITSDLNATEPGEYCNVYNTGETGQVKYQNNNDRSSITGFDPGRPLYYWQQGDDRNDVCQAKGTRWGFEIRGSDLNNFCTQQKPQFDTEPCGMHHFVRLSGGLGNRPWSSRFGAKGSPALQVSMETDPTTASLRKDGAAWGYMCPILVDTTHPNFQVEYCFKQWSTTKGYPLAPGADRRAACAGVKINGLDGVVDQVITSFGADRTYSTTRAGSKSTFTFRKGAAVPMKATISRGNLLAAINRLRAPFEDNSPNGGCGRQEYSTNPDDWALVGYEQGIEGGRIDVLGANVANTRMSTTTDTLYPGETLTANRSIVSDDGSKTLTMRRDGRLTVSDAKHRLLWATRTRGATNARVTMQPDGNLVMSRKGKAIWRTRTNGQTGAYATIQPDGNLVVYRGARARWSSHGGRLR